MISLQISYFSLSAQWVMLVLACAEMCIRDSAHADEQDSQAHRDARLVLALVLLRHQHDKGADDHADRRERRRFQQLQDQVLVVDVSQTKDLGRNCGTDICLLYTST